VQWRAMANGSWRSGGVWAPKKGHRFRERRKRPLEERGIGNAILGNVRANFWGVEPSR